MAVIIDSTAVINAVRLKEQAGDPAAPAATYWLLYAKAAGLYAEDSSSAVTGPFGTGGGSADSIAPVLTNGSGGTVNLGDVVIIDSFTMSSFYTSGGGFPDDTTVVYGVVTDATILNGATGHVALFGLVPQINLDTSGNQADTLSASNTNKQATPRQNSFGFDTASFGFVIGSGTTPAAFIWGVPIQPTERKLWTETSFNLNSGSAFSLTPPIPTGRSCVITRVVIRNASTGLVAASLSFGFNAGTYDDVIATATHVELTGPTLYTVLVPKIGAVTGVAASHFGAKCTTVQGSAATCDIDVFGYLF